MSQPQRLSGSDLALATSPGRAATRTPTASLRPLTEPVLRELLRDAGVPEGFVGATLGDLDERVAQAIRAEPEGSFLGYGVVACLVAFVNAALLAVIANAPLQVGRAASVICSYAPVGWIWHFIGAVCPAFAIRSCRPRAPPATAT